MSCGAHGSPLLQVQRKKRLWAQQDIQVLQEPPCSTHRGLNGAMTGTRTPNLRVKVRLGLGLGRKLLARDYIMPSATFGVSPKAGRTASTRLAARSLLFAESREWPLTLPLALALP